MLSHRCYIAATLNNQIKYLALKLNQVKKLFTCRRKNDLKHATIAVCLCVHQPNLVSHLVNINCGETTTIWHNVWLMPYNWCVSDILDSLTFLCFYSVKSIYRSKMSYRRSVNLRTQKQCETVHKNKVENWRNIWKRNNLNDAMAIELPP